MEAKDDGGPWGHWSFLWEIGSYCDLGTPWEALNADQRTLLDSGFWMLLDSLLGGTRVKEHLRRNISRTWGLWLDGIYLSIKHLGKERAWDQDAGLQA